MMRMWTSNAWINIILPDPARQTEIFQPLTFPFEAGALGARLPVCSGLVCEGARPQITGRRPHTAAGSDQINDPLTGALTEGRRGGGG